MNFYKHYLGDYARDTKGLSLIEHGAYRVLLDHIYATEERLPDSMAELYRIAGAMTPAERKAVEKVADRFFPVNGDGRRYNKRAEEEIQKHSGQAQANRIVAEERERKRREERSRHESGNDQSTNRLTIDAPSHSQKPEETKAQGAKAPSSEPAVPDCPHEAILGLYAKHLPMLTQPRLWEGRRAELLRVRWRACARRNEVWPGYTTVEAGLAFWDQFFADVAKCKPLRDGIPRGDGSSWKADLPWLLKAENFAKVIEGKYLR